MLLLVALVLPQVASGSGGADDCPGTPQKQAPTGGGGIYFDCMPTSVKQEAAYAWGKALNNSSAKRARHTIAMRMDRIKNRASVLAKRHKGKARRAARRGKKVTGGGKQPWEAGVKVGRWMKRHFPPGKIKDRLPKAAKDCGVFGLAMFAITWAETHKKQAALFAGANGCAGAIIAEMRRK